MSRVGRALAGAALLLAVLAGAGFIALQRWLDQPLHIGPAAVTVEVQPGQPLVAAANQCEGEQGKVVSNLAADPVLRGICESDLHRIPAVPVELVEVFVVLVSSVSRLNHFCLLCPSFLTAAETKRRQQSAERKVDYRD